MSDPKKRGLGRGLAALMPPRPAPTATATAMAPPSGAPAGAPSGAPTVGTPATAPRGEPARSRTYFHAGIEDVYPSPEQPRRVFETVALDELAASIRAHGVLMPLVVRARSGGGYFLIAGERRWRAAQRAGLHEVPVVVQEVTPAIAFERALVENLQRADLGALEEAAAYERLIEEFGLTQEQIAARLGKDRSTIANALRLLRLPAPVRQLVDERTLSMGHARALLGLEDDAAIERTARQVIARGLSVRATESLVKKARTPAPPRPPTPAAGKSASVLDLEERLTRALGGPVTISEDAPGKAGRIEIRYLDLDHLDKLLDKLL
jgi:ParB family chromosome partitioning protein